MTSEQAMGSGRVQAPFEDYPGCPVPPLPAMQSPWDPAVPKRLGLRERWFTRAAMRAGFLLSGFGAFHRRLTRDGGAYLERGTTPPPPGPMHLAVQGLEDDPGTDPFLRAASLLAALRDLHDEIRGGRFRPDFAHGQPAESRPYLNVMGTSILCEGDEPVRFKTASTSRFLVMARRRQYRVDVDEGDGAPSVATLRAALEEAWQRSGPPDAPLPEPGVGMLACLPGQVALFRALSADPANRAALEAVKHAFVTLSLELDRFPETDAEAARWALAGDFGNRWSYASLQIVVFGNGKACQIGNAACLIPGNVIMRTAAELRQRGVELARAAGGPARPAAVAEVEWNLEPVDFGAAAKVLDRILDDQEATFDLAGFGRTALAEAGLRPVEFFTIAVQHATQRLTGKLPITVQAVSTEGFRYGTRGAALVSTPETAALHEALRDPATSPATLRRLYAQAVESQRSACRVERGLVGIERQFGWFTAELAGLRGRVSRAVLQALWRVVGAPTFPRTDVQLSHPAITEGVLIMGRPGIRVARVSCFAMHYQILEDRVRFMVSRGAAWQVPNERLVAELEASLRELAARVGEPRAVAAAA